jgi:hypothetical protein
MTLDMVVGKDIDTNEEPGIAWGTAPISLSGETNLIIHNQMDRSTDVEMWQVCHTERLRHDTLSSKSCIAVHLKGKGLFHRVSAMCKYQWDSYDIDGKQTQHPKLAPYSPVVREPCQQQRDWLPQGAMGLATRTHAAFCHPR